MAVSRSTKASTVIAPPLVPIATEPIPEVCMIPVGCPDEPVPFKIPKSRPTLIPSKMSVLTKSSIPGVACISIFLENLDSVPKVLGVIEI